ncbi:hypothetical protein [Streptomyces buecherae]|nr:hypothetical protein [Streptomyces buecherae]
MQLGELTQFVGNLSQRLASREAMRAQPADGAVLVYGLRDRVDR